MLYTFFMAKDLFVSRLCDAYGSLLTEHMRSVVRDYFDYDLSLAEIAENYGVTRQAALCTVRQAEAKLRDYEDRMGLVQKADRLSSSLEELSREIEGDITAAKSRIERILSELTL